MRRNTGCVGMVFEKSLLDDGCRLDLIGLEPGAVPEIGVDQRIVPVSSSILAAACGPMM
jgi:hypothetical protein